MTDQFGGIAVTSTAQAAAEAEKLAQAGVDVIKAHSGLTRDDYKAIADAAHKRSIRVHAHVYAEEDVRNALETGIDVLSACGLGRHGAAVQPAADYRHRQRRPSGGDHRGASQLGLSRHRRLPRAAAGSVSSSSDMPPAVYAEVQDSLKNWRALGYFARTDREMIFRERGVKQFIESGAVLGMGTDSGTPMNFHSEALWREAKVHVDMGMPPIKVISALTRVGANILGKQRDLGTIEPGKLADIIVVNGNPLFDITALSHVETVVKGGRVYKSVASTPTGGQSQ